MKSLLLCRRLLSCKQDMQQYVMVHRESRLGQCLSLCLCCCTRARAHTHTHTLTHSLTHSLTRT